MREARHILNIIYAFEVALTIVEINIKRHLPIKQYVNINFPFNPSLKKSYNPSALTCHNAKTESKEMSQWRGVRIKGKSNPKHSVGLVLCSWVTLQCISKDQVITD